MILDGKVVLITDAASPSGMAVAKRFASEGARLALNDPDGALQDSQAAFAGTASPTDRIQVETLIDRVTEQMGRIDVLIHNSRLVPRRTLVECTDEEFLDVMNANAKSAFLFTQAAGRKMKTAGSGKIVYLSTIHAEKPTGCTFPYSLAAGAVKMLARETALDLGAYGISANFVEWGPTSGDEKVFVDGAVSFLYDNMLERIPNKMAGTLEELAELALFFASDRCGFVNGADLRADGGFTLSYMPRYRYEDLDRIAKEGTK